MNYLRGIRLREPPERDSYLAGIPAVRCLGAMEELRFERPVTFFAGENGTGKSTVLEAIACAMGFNPEGGSRDHSFSTRDTHSELGDRITCVRLLPPEDGFFLRAESFYNAATYLEENGKASRYGGVSLHERSHGEAFLALVRNRFAGHGLYLLDEPEAALSAASQLSLLAEMDRLVREGSQFLIVTHSPILMAYPGADILLFSEDGICRTDYRSTDSYRITRRVLSDPEGILEILLADGEE